MNIVMLVVLENKDMQTKEWILNLFDFFAIGIMLGTGEGSHARLTLSIWRVEISTDFHHWNFNIVKHKSGG